METKKQIKAQLRNQISKEYKDCLDNAKQECMTARAKFIAEQKLRVFSTRQNVQSTYEKVFILKIMQCEL